MRVLRTFLFAIVAVIGISVIGISAQSFTPKAVSARSIEQQVYKKLRSLPRYNVFDNITVEVNGSTVTLGGKVITLGTKSMAANFVKDIPGVKEVVNKIDELPVSPYDDRIRREAYRTFISRGPGQYFPDQNPEVRIIVENGRITLEGLVRRQSDSDTLYILANGVNGVFQVNNNLVVGRRAS